MEEKPDGEHSKKPVKSCEKGYVLNAGSANLPSLADFACAIDPQRRELLLSGCDKAAFKKVFENEELMCTAEAFLSGGMNISGTARSLYMHRNTLNYRLKAIERITGLDIRKFGDAMTFKILQIFYFMK